MARNLGASQACTSISDTACFGDYYQWGRGADGHQESNSSIYPSKIVLSSNSTSFITNNSNYGYNSDWTISDSTGTTRRATWNKTDGTSICPTGFRVPNSTELLNETKVLTYPNQVVMSSQFYSNSTLKVPEAKHRDNLGTISNIAILQLWSNTINGSVSDFLYFSSSSGANIGQTGRIDGMPIRCIKN